MTRHNVGIHALGLLFLLTAGLAEGAANLPQKAFNVEGGTVSARAGVMPNPDAPAALPIGKLKYPTRYFVDLVNESPYPIWLDATWAFPEAKKDKAAKAQTTSSKKVPARGSYWFYFDKLGVVVDTPIVIEMRAYSDEKRVKLIGSQVAEIIFDKKSVDVFLANFPNPFKNQSDQSKQSSVISGWHDIPAPRTDIPGTLADAELQRDIQLSIWKADSTRRWTCEREILSAAALSVDDSQVLSRLPNDMQEKAKLDHADNKISFEKWTVRSCGSELVYEVLLSVSQSGGTDVMVIETTEGFGLQSEIPELTDN